MTVIRELADEFHTGWLAAHPFDATYSGVPGFDDRVPDVSETGQASRRSSVAGVLGRARAAITRELSVEDTVTVGCLIGLAEQELAEIDATGGEHTVTTLPFIGPAELLATASRSVLPDADAAADYLERLRQSGTFIDQHIARLRSGAAKGRLPVAPLVGQTLEWVEHVLDQRVPDSVAAPQPPAGWSGAAAWQAELDSIATDFLVPGLQRWRDELAQLLPVSRPAEHAGLSYLPDGAENYARAIRAHTTLDIDAERLHAIGLEELEALEQRELELGSTIGLSDLPSIHDALRESASRRSTEDAIEAARSAVRRAESRLAEAFPPPLPSPCDVSPMPYVVAAAGTPPHYSPPRLDGTRAGTYWFNTESPTMGAGWDLEVVAFHEAVPGHHLQFARLSALGDLPALQRQREVMAYSEGWGLYAEQLAEEMGLYSDAESILGSMLGALLRATRLVVDTGLHAFGWGREEALAFAVAHVPATPEFLAAEIDRYISWPGQALAYLTGKREILAARERALIRLGPAFSLPAFHGTLLDSGSLPLPVMHDVIDRWIAATLT